MKRVLRYLSHPQVDVDPNKPVPEWSLSAHGRKRASVFSKVPLLQHTTKLVSSDETKATETARIVAQARGLSVSVRPATHENDRSSTGFLHGPDFEETADAFFASPNDSVRGWERAIDAQRRIVGEVTMVLEEHLTGDILMVGHGAVGTLLYCHFAECKIDRRYDQPAGGGNVIAIDIDTRQPLHHWTPIEQFLENEDHG